MVLPNVIVLVMMAGASVVLLGLVVLFVLHACVQGMAQLASPLTRRVAPPVRRASEALDARLHRLGSAVRPYRRAGQVLLWAWSLAVTGFIAAALGVPLGLIVWINFLGEAPQYETPTYVGGIAFALTVWGGLWLYVGLRARRRQHHLDRQGFIGR